MPRDEPALHFSSPVDAGDEGRDAGEGPVRARRDAHGRPIYFREVPLNRHGADRDAGVAQDNP